MTPASPLVGTIGLALVLAVATILTVARPRISRDPRRVRRVAVATLVAVAMQAAHFLEELATGFPMAFPRALGLAPWSPTFFVTFNVAWLALWLLALPALRADLVPALVPLWFLALAGVVNLVAHPALALRTGGYFPGLLTAPLVGLAGAVLVRELWALTAPGYP